jgi:hypothetical protein
LDRPSLTVQAKVKDGAAAAQTATSKPGVNLDRTRGAVTAVNFVDMLDGENADPLIPEQVLVETNKPWKAFSQPVMIMIPDGV